LVVPRWVLGVVAAAVAVAAIDVAVYVLARDGTPAADAQLGANLVAVIDPTTSRVVDRVQVGRTPTIVAAGYGGAWVLNKGEGTLTHLDARSHHVVGTLRLDVTPTDLREAMSRTRRSSRSSSGSILRRRASTETSTRARARPRSRPAARPSGRPG
jgi:YVTN family beta-propeller protein